MNGVTRYAGLFLICWLMLAGVGFGKEVYLKDGGVIDAKSVSRKGNKVFVLVNRDTMVEFTQGEVDLKRTFPKSAAAKRHGRHKMVKAAVPSAAEPAAKAPAAATPAPANGAPQAAQPAPATAKPAASQTPPAANLAPQQAAPPAPQPAAQKSAEAMKNNSGDAVKNALQAKQAERLKQLGALSSGVIAGIVVALLVITVLLFASQWIIFQRAGVAGWKCLIPVYNMYILMQISGKPGWWAILLFVPLIGVVVYLFAMLSLAKKFGKSELYGVGLLLLPMIFFPLLAFGKAEYEG